MNTQEKILGHALTKNNCSVVMQDNMGLIRTFTMASSHPSFNLVVAKLKKNEADGLINLFDVSSAINAWANPLTEPLSLRYGRIQVSGGVVRFAGEPVHSTIATRIIDMMKEGVDASPLIKFLENVQANPLESARRELFDFLEGNSLPLTVEGKFLAYKRIRHDYLDLYTGTMDNSVGAQPTLNREECDTNRHNTCSRGLHFASLHYARDCYGRSSTDRLVVVEIDPADVVSIPVDYNNQKGRAWTYKIIGEIAMGTLQQEDLLEDTVVIDNNEWNDEEESYEDFLRRKARKQKRDSRGRFI